MTCEKCWAEAYRMSIGNGKMQYLNYNVLLKERAAHPCTPQEQAGQFWDDEKQRDKRFNPHPLKPVSNE